MQSICLTFRPTGRRCTTITGKAEKFAANAKIIHIDVDAASISRNIKADIPVAADAKKAICALLEKAEPLSISEWKNKIEWWKKEYPLTMGEAGLTPQKIIQSINRKAMARKVSVSLGQKR